MFRRIILSVILSIVMLFSLQVIANSAVVQYNYDFEFSGATAPTGPTPWLSMTLDDDDTPGSVTLKMVSENLVMNEFVSEWYLNVDPLYRNTLTMNYGDSTVLPTSILGGENLFKADGVGGWFDILFSYNDPHNKFGQDDYTTLYLFGSGITVDTFNCTSFQKHDLEGLFTAAHVQGIGEDSGWVTCGTTSPVPLPGTALLLLSGVGLLVTKRKMFYED